AGPLLSGVRLRYLSARDGGPVRAGGRNCNCSTSRMCSARQPASQHDPATRGKRRFSLLPLVEKIGKNVALNAAFLGLALLGPILSDIAHEGRQSPRQGSCLPSRQSSRRLTTG